MAEHEIPSSTLRFDLRLLIRHPTLDPELISARLGMTPRMTQTSGKPRVAPNGVALTGTYDDSRWGWSVRIEGRREFFEEVSALAERLRPHKHFLSEVVDSGGSIEIIVHLPGDTNIGWTMPWTQLAALAQLKIDLGVEVFPNFN